MSRIVVLFVLLLVGCGSTIWNKAEPRLIGMSYSDLLSCAGPPDQEAGAGTMGAVVYAKSTFSSNPIYLPQKDGTSITIPNDTTYECKAILTIRDGRVAKIKRTGDSPYYCYQRFEACFD